MRLALTDQQRSDLLGEFNYVLQYKPYPRKRDTLWLAKMKADLVNYRALSPLQLETTYKVLNHYYKTDRVKQYSLDKAAKLCKRIQPKCKPHLRPKFAVALAAYNKGDHKGLRLKLLSLIVDHLT